MRKDLFFSVFLAAILFCLSSCKPSSQSLIVGKWYCISYQCKIDWIEFKKDGILIDADGKAYDYKISDDDLILSTQSTSVALKIESLTETELVLLRDNERMTFRHTQNVIEPINNIDSTVGVAEEICENETNYLSDNESVSSHYVQEEYWESGDITNLNAVITDIVRNLDNTASTTVNETVSVEYFENGKIKKETFYRNGEKQRTVEYFENGSVFEEMTFDEEGNYFGNWRRYGPDENGNGHYLIFESKIDANGNGYEWYRYNEDRRRATNISVKTTYLNHKPVSEVYSKLINGEWRQFEY